MPTDEHHEGCGFASYHLSRSAIDDLASGSAQPTVIQQLQQAERSRRLLLLRALDEKLTKDPTLVGPLTAPDDVWELLARAERVVPEAMDLLLAHPYTGAWAGYVTRLLRDKITGVCPLWMHVGHLHALAAAVAIRGGLSFALRVPVWDGGAIIPTVGMARLAADTPYSVADVHVDRDVVEISNAATTVRLPRDHAGDATNWWGMRTLATRSGHLALSVRLDDLDPYRGLYEPVPPQRIARADVDGWQHVLNEAWHIVSRCLPDLAAGFATGLHSLVPRPAVPLRTLSASTGEAFGSAIIAQPADAATLAATLVHEFHHNLLGGLLHMIPLYEHDPAERFYTLWRDDPRPIAGVLSGIHAFFGVTAFWRALGRDDPGEAERRAGFEYAYWRDGTWRVLRSLSGDPHLTEAGQRFLDSITARLRPWLDEPVPAGMAELAGAAAADHHAGWRIRHLRPPARTVQSYTDAWVVGRQRPSLTEPDGRLTPTPIPDGSWCGARTDLIRAGLAVAEPDPEEITLMVPDATRADVAYVSGHNDRAIHGYRSELAEDGNRPDSWVGLGLALSAREPGADAARALLRCPELVRAVHRSIRSRTGTPPAPEELADWIGRSGC
ncbi:HEXXH motif domain-containing protein [Actinophytocola sp.]|uniref:HEXXH motif domain-containing protein n=1 Tax=Actinophytocola sp. TaxID=1872138 RepID=UPI003D6AE6E0